MERSAIASQSLRDQWQQLVLRPLSKINGNGYQSVYILVVDALDECDDHNIRIVLHLLAEARALETVRLRIFLTSRPEASGRQSWAGTGFYKKPARPMGPRPKRVIAEESSKSPTLVDYVQEWVGRI